MKSLGKPKCVRRKLSDTKSRSKRSSVLWARPCKRRSQSKMAIGMAMLRVRKQCNTAHKFIIDAFIADLLCSLYMSIYGGHGQTTKRAKGPKMHGTLVLSHRCSVYFREMIHSVHACRSERQITSDMCGLCVRRACLPMTFACSDLDLWCSVFLCSAVRCCEWVFRGEKDAFRYPAACTWI